MTAPALSPRSLRKRESILSVGCDLFLASGFQATSMDQIAAAAQVSKQTVYKHFGDKQELLHAIVAQVVDSTVAPFLDQIAALAVTVDLQHDLMTLGSGYLAAVLAEPVVQLRRLVVGESNRLPDLAQSYYKRVPARTLSALADAFAELDARGLLDVPDKSVAAEHFAFLVVGRSIDRALFYGGPDTLDNLDVDTRVRAAVRVFLAAYGGPAQQRPSGGSV